MATKQEGRRPKRGRGRPRKYDWQTLLAHQRVTLWRGRDYDCEAASIASQARMAGRYLGLHVRVELLPDRVVIEVTDAQN